MKKQQGFTLIELMLTVAIVGVLATIATPLYGKYVMRAQMSEGFTITGPARRAVELMCSLENRLPTDNADAHQPEPSNIYGKYSDNVEIKDGLVIVTFGKESRPELHGEQITWTPGDCVLTNWIGGWNCSATDGIAQYVPRCSSTAVAKPANNINNPDEGETFCQESSTSLIGREGGIRSKYLDKPKEGQTAKDVLLSQLNDMGSNTLGNGINMEGTWDQFFLKRPGDGGNCRVLSTNKNYYRYPGGNDKWIGDFITDTLTEIGVSKDDFNITITSVPGQKLKDQTVNISYKDNDGTWKDYSVVIGETGSSTDGRWVDKCTGTLKEGEIRKTSC
jgi:type IV pilus assembly protein PilA